MTVQITVTVAGTDRTTYFMREGFQIDQRVNAIGTATIRFGPLTSPLVTVGDEIIIYDTRLSANIFGGYVKDLTVDFINNTNFYQECHCQDYSKLVYDTTGIDKDYSSGGLNYEERAIVLDLFSTYLPAISAGAYVNTPAPRAYYPGYVWKDAHLDKCMGDLTRGIYSVTPGDNRTWYVDANKALHYFAQLSTPESAPFGLSDSPNLATTFPYQYRTLEYTNAIDGSERITVTCWQPGLSIGQTLAITNSPLGWSAKTWQITNISTSIKGLLTQSGYALEYKVTLGTLPIQQVSTQAIVPSAQMVKMSPAGNQYIIVPSGNTDPSTSQGDFYYNSTTGKFRYYDSAGWHDLTPGTTSFGTPALTLTTANAAGAASTAIRTDASILAFDATVPAALGAAAAGAAAVAARRDHVHPEITAPYTDVTSSRSLGVTYHNTSGKPMMVNVCCTMTPDGFGLMILTGKIGPSSANVSVSSQGINIGISAVSAGLYTVTFMVPNNYYYGVENPGGAVSSKNFWIEWTIG